MKRYYATRKEANKALACLKDKANKKFTGCPDGIFIYDLKKTFPNRIKTRFFVGDYFEYLNI